MASESTAGRGHRFESLKERDRAVIEKCQKLYVLGRYTEAVQELGTLDCEHPAISVQIAQNLLAQGNWKTARLTIRNILSALDQEKAGPEELKELIVLQLMHTFLRIRAEGPLPELHDKCKSIYDTHLFHLSPEQFTEVLVSVIISPAVSNLWLKYGVIGRRRDLVP